MKKKLVFALIASLIASASFGVAKQQQPGAELPPSANGARAWAD